MDEYILKFKKEKEKLLINEATTLKKKKKEKKVWWISSKWKKEALESLKEKQQGLPSNYRENCHSTISCVKYKTKEDALKAWESYKNKYGFNKQEEYFLINIKTCENYRLS